MKRVALAFLCVLPSCDSDEAPYEAPEFALPAPDDTFLLGAAGAPQRLFGDAAAPTFATAFAALADDGFNRFVPVFLTDENGAGTDHLTYFLPHAAFPEAVVGPIPSAIMCDGPNNAWTAARGHLQIVLPAYALLMDYPVTEALDPTVVRQRYEAFVRDCLAGDTSQVGGLYLYDEPANNYMTSTCCDGDPDATFTLGNVAVLADMGRDVVGASTMVIEAPTPFFLELVAEPWGIPAADLPGMLETFWTGVAATAPSADVYGFDVYPVDLVTDFATIADHAALGREHAPAAMPIVVLQGFGMADMNIDVGTPGRRPTRSETRALAFLAAIAGVRGIYWYGQSALVLGEAIWDDVREVARDLRRVSGILGLPPLVTNVGASTVEVIARRGDGVTYVVFANTAPVATAITLPLTATAHRVVDVVTGSVVAENVSGEFVLPVAAYDARVLALVD